VISNDIIAQKFNLMFGDKAAEMLARRDQLTLNNNFITLSVSI